MTVAENTNPINSSIANGVTTVFPYGFQVIDDEDITVAVAGVVQTTGFTVTGVGGVGGTVVFSIAPANGELVVLYLDPVLERETDYQQFGDWLANEVNRDFDRLWLALQGAGKRIDAAVHVDLSDVADGLNTKLPAPIGNSAIAWAADGKSLVNITLQTGTTLADLAAPTGAALVAFIQEGTGAVERTLENKNREVISVLDFMTTAEKADVRAGTFLLDVTAAMNAAASAASAQKRALFVPSGGYKMTSPWDIPPKVHVIGESLGAQTGYDPGAQFNYGAVIYKAHGGSAIRKIGSVNGTPGAPIERICVSSNRSTWPTGNGFELDKVSLCHITHCTAFGVGGDSFAIGITAGASVTFHNYLTHCYSNNPGGVNFNIRQEFSRLHSPVSDGGTYGLLLRNAPGTMVEGFHFEGFTVAPLDVSSDTVGAVFYGKNLVNNSAGATGAAQIRGTYTVLQDVSFNGGIVGATAILIYASAYAIKVIGGLIDGYGIGIENNGGFDGTIVEVSRVTFANCALPIKSNALASNYLNNTFAATTGTYAIQHLSGTVGLWQGNVLDKPIQASLTGVPGNYGGITVKDNFGHVSAASGQTALIASPAIISHGMAGVPSVDIVLVCYTAGRSAPTINLLNATQFGFEWTGGDAQWGWRVRLPCNT